MTNEPLSARGCDWESQLCGEDKRGSNLRNCAMATTICCVLGLGLLLHSPPPASINSAALRASRATAAVLSSGRVPPQDQDEYYAALNEVCSSIFASSIFSFHNAFRVPRLSCDSPTSQVEAANARLRAAEQRLAVSGSSRAPPPPTRVKKPRGARTKVDTSDAGTLLVEVPAARLGASTLMGGAFSAAWFSAIVPATASVIAGGAALTGGLFMVPFWLAGGAVAKQTILDPAKATSLSIGEYAWELKQTLPGGVAISQESGPSEELSGANVEVAVYTNGVPTYQLRLGAGGRLWTLGDGLPAEELEWIAEEINAQIEWVGSTGEEFGEGEGSAPRRGGDD